MLLGSDIAASPQRTERSRDLPRRRALGRHLPVLALAGLLLSGAAVAAEVRTVALSGQSAPGTEPGTTFLRFTSFPFFGPPISAEGTAALFARLDGPGVTFDNDSGVWLEADGALVLAAQAGDPAPGTGPGVVFVDFSIFELPTRPSFGAGRTVWNGLLTGSGVSFMNSAGLWSSDGATTELLIRTGDPAPGEPAGVTFQELQFRGLGPDGDALLSARVTGSAIGPSNDEALWSDRDGTLIPVLREGDSPAGLPAGVVVERPGAASAFGATTSGPGGRVATATFLAGPGVGGGNDEAVILEDPSGVPLLVAREGGTVPGHPTETFGDGGTAEFASLSSALPGAVVFTATLDDGANLREGAFSNLGGPLETLALTGDPAPGSGGTFLFLGNVSMNARGEHLLRATTTASPAIGGLWISNGGGLAAFAVPGALVPGLAAGTELLGVGLVHGFSDAGLAAFDATIQASGQTPRSVILVGNPEAGFEVAVELGAPFDVAGDGSDLRNVIAFDLEHFSADGDLYSELRFADGSSGIFVQSFTAVAFADGFESGDTTAWSLTVD